jgi:type IV secretory pathway component VirB8
MVAQEYETSRQQVDMRERNRNLFWTSLITMFAAITAAVVAIVK